MKKIKHDAVLAYVVIPTSRAGFPKVWPIHHVDIHTSDGMFSGYVHGSALNGTYDDSEGCALAEIASQAIGALERRAVASRLVPAKRRKR